jgi:triphosphatase
MMNDVRMEEPRVAIVRSYRPAHAYDHARAVKARRVRLVGAMTVEEAFRATVLECLAQVGGNAPAIRGRDPEGVHQIRVGLRRLQMALASFGDYADLPEMKALGKRGRALADAFGPARDLEVFSTELLEPVAKGFRDSESFAALDRAVRHARGEAWDDALGEILNPEFGAFLNEMSAAAESVPSDRRRIRKAGRKALETHFRKVRKRGKRVGRAYDNRVHKLRIALKKMRYAAEFFAPLYPEKKTEAYLKALKRLLDRMGEANDAHGIPDLLKRLDGGPSVEYATGAVSGWYAARQPALTKTAIKGWKDFRKLKPFWA